ncbi:fructose bisphosphate aldolase [Photobacterium indicum]|uniref:fructose bisphosphate aldolase n=1 Tax=Photobacterium indicum TaxID=81447 RepID=UPI003D14835B
MTIFEQQCNSIKNHKGFIAALDQSGGSTPKALKTYGIKEDAYHSNEEMFELVHEMRSRIITSPAFNTDNVLGAILFENTLDRQIKGKASSRYLWEEKQVVPFLKVDQGLESEANGVQLMKPIPDLEPLLVKAKQKGVFGTKMRSLILHADSKGIAQIVAQQFEVAKQISAAGLVPIIEPEINIHNSDKKQSEIILRTEIMSHLDTLNSDQLVMLKVSLPEQANFYQVCIAHPNVIKVVALSGGFPIDEANRRLAENLGMIASFSRVLTDNLYANQSDNNFNAALKATIEPIYLASIT